MGGTSEEEGTLPPGFRFHPTDEELISHYLSRKISDANFVARAIADVDLNKCEPWDLPGRAKNMGEKAWYFFSTRDRKYPTGVRTNRATKTGYWKTTGKDREICCSATAPEPLGMKKTLVFYKGRAPRGEKSNWVMHEYRVHTESASRNIKDEWVVCRVFQKSSMGKKSPMNQSRANAYNLRVAFAPTLMTPMIQGDRFLHDPHHIGSLSRSCGADLAELTRAFRWNAGPAGMNHSTQSQASYAAGSSTLPGLNLNLVAPSITPPPVAVQPVPRLPESLPQRQHHEANVTLVSAAGTLPGCNLPTCERFGAAQPDMINAHSAGGGWFQQVDRCADLDGCFWPSY